MSYSNYYNRSNILHCSIDKTMGTQLDILMVGSDESMLQKVWREVETRLQNLEEMMSRYSKGGELYRINRDAKRTPFIVSDELWSILRQCYDYYEETDGCFDITLGYHSSVDLDNNSRSIRVLDDGVELDLGGYGKGYALREIGHIAKERGVESLFVSFGNSSILATGHHPSGDCWKISTNNPYTGDSLDSYELRDTTLTVSGNSPAHEGHIFDPIKGISNHKRQMVAIVCGDPTIGEMLSTTGMVMESTRFDTLTTKYSVTTSKITEL